MEEEDFTEGMAKLEELQRAPYQRPIDKGQIEKIDREFLPALARQLQIAVRTDNSLHVLDGQHTVEVLKRRGYGEWSARFHHGLSYQEEANRFVYYNESTRRVQSIYKFKARLEGQDQSTHEIAGVLDDHDLAIPGTERREGLTPIRSVSMLEGIYRVGGATLLGTVLHVAKMAWGHEDPVVTYNTRVIPGLARLLLNSTRPLGTERFVNVLTVEEQHPKTLEKMVKGVSGSNAVIAKRLYSAYINGTGSPSSEKGRKAYRIQQRSPNYPYLSIHPIELGTVEQRRMGVWSAISDSTIQKKITVDKPSYLIDDFNELQMEESS